MHTSVAIDKEDFDEFIVREGLHIAINVKDFKAAVIHADSMKAAITARYTRACRPLQLAYTSEDGVESEFTLMTRGEVDENDNDDDGASRAASQLSARPSARHLAVPAANGSASTSSATATTSMPPPPSRPSVTQPTSSRQPELMSSAASRAALADIKDSLFVPADDDRQWDEQVFDEEDDTQDILGWDSNIEPVCLPLYQKREGPADRLIIGSIP